MSLKTCTTKIDHEIHEVTLMSSITVHISTDYIWSLKLLVIIQILYTFILLDYYFSIIEMLLYFLLFRFYFNF